MGVDRFPEPNVEVERELEKTNSQLALYARDLKKLLAREAEKAEELAAANDRLQALAGELEQSNARVKAILNSITDAFLAVDGSWRFTYVNEAAERLVTRSPEQLVGRILWEELPSLFDSTVRKQLEEGVSSDRAFSLETFSPALDAWLDVRLYPWQDGLSLYLRDVTERKALEKQVQQSQKMEVLGRLAGGVAHDFNNLLTAITGYSELALADLDKGGAQRDDLESIKRAAARASSLTRQLLAFSRKQVLEPKVVDLNSLVTNLEKMLRRLIGEDVTLVTELAPNLGRVEADPGQIEQLVLNLAVNARDAMPQGGRLTIETKNVDREDSARTSHGGDLQRAYVALAITDTGCGMDDKTKSRIFEPFFTTKEVGKGTGLGLATVYGIVEQSGGHIEVTSEIDRGSTFRVFLPRIAANTEVTDSATSFEEPSATARGETILVVEDQDDVRALTRRNLERCGYAVLEARGGAEALEVSQRHRGPIHLMVTDIVMPNMSGLEVAKRLGDSRPDMKTLFMSGYTDDAVVRHGLPPGGGGILQKPFNAATLAARVRDMLSDTG